MTTTKRDFRDNLIAPSAKIIDTLRIIDGHGVPVGLVHEDGRLVGTVTDGDIRRGLLAGIPLDAPVAKVMNVAPKMVLQGTPDAVVLKMMQAYSILYVPVVDARDHVVDLKILKDMLPDVDGRGPDLATDGDDAASATSMDNIVVIMAGGKGERLRPLTADRPKPMVEVGGRPILETIVERFVRQGFTQLYISVNYRREMIEDYFGDGAKWGAHIRYIREDSALGTAGALSLLPERPTQAIIVMNGDLVTRVNFRHLIDFHNQHGTAATMAVWEARFAVPYGVVTTEDTRLTVIEEKPVKSFLVNAGIYVLAPEMLDLIPRGRAINITNLFSMQLSRAKDGAAAPVVFPLREYWIDVGRVEDVERAHHDLRTMIKEV
ncbi:MAG: alcohol dehydrogenase [Rhodospirillaceae bacterium]|nr:MAG: alcohol dehydrogenase [Rhodospirillaceae bacterium]